MKIELFCLDFDGVIVESSALKVELFCQAAKEQNPTLGAALYEALVDGELIGASRFSISHWLTFNDKSFNGDLFLQRFADLLNQATFLIVREGFEEFLHHHHKQGSIMTIVSSAPSSDIKHILTLNKIDFNLFEGIYGSNAGDKYQIVDRLLEKTAIKAKNAIFIGDLPSDHKVALSFQMPFIRFESLIGKQSADIPFQSTPLVKSFRELEDLLKERL